MNEKQVSAFEAKILAQEERDWDDVHSEYFYKREKAVTQLQRQKAEEKLAIVRRLMITEENDFEAAAESAKLARRNKAILSTYNAKKTLERQLKFWQSRKGEFASTRTLQLMLENEAPVEVARVEVSDEPEKWEHVIFGAMPAKMPKIVNGAPKKPARVRTPVKALKTLLFMHNYQHDYLHTADLPVDSLGKEYRFKDSGSRLEVSVFLRNSWHWIRPKEAKKYRLNKVLANVEELFTI